MNTRLDEHYITDALPVMAHRHMLALMDLSLPTDMLEVYVATITGAWGAWVVIWDLAAHTYAPWADLSVAANIPNLTFTFLPQWAWGLLGCVLGCGHLLTRVGQLSRRRLWLIGILMYWMAVTLTILVQVPHSTGVIAYGGLAFGAGISGLRLYIIGTRRQSVASRGA